MKWIRLQFFHKRQKLFALFFGLFFALIVMTIIPSLFKRMNQERFNLGTVEEWIGPGEIKDQQVGSKATPNSCVNHKKSSPDNTVFDATYTFDQYSRRVTPQGPDEAFFAHALFFGGSFTMGEAVDDHETLPAQVAQKLSGYRVYNFGFCAYGPNNSLAQLQGMSPDQIPEKSGFAVYTFIDHHIDRAIGRLSVVSGWAKNFPYYYLDEKGRLVRKGSFLTGRFLVSIRYLLTGQAYVHFGKDLPEKIDDEHVELTARMIVESYKTAHKKLGTKRMVMVFYPGSNFHKMAEELEKNGIDCLDYSALFNPGEEQYHHGIDWHPTPTAFGIIANKLMEDLVRLGVVDASAVHRK